MKSAVLKNENTRPWGEVRRGIHQLDVDHDSCCWRSVLPSVCCATIVVKVNIDRDIAKECTGGCSESQVAIAINSGCNLESKGLIAQRNFSGKVGPLGSFICWTRFDVGRKGDIQDLSLDH